MANHLFRNLLHSWAACENLVSLGSAFRALLLIRQPLVVRQCATHQQMTLCVRGMTQLAS